MRAESRNMDLPLEFEFRLEDRAILVGVEVRACGSLLGLAAPLTASAGGRSVHRDRANFIRVVERPCKLYQSCNRSHNLKLNVHLKAHAEIYTMHSFALQKK